MKTEVLNHNQIQRICNRFAFQILENSMDGDELFIIGVKTKGYEIAKIVKKQIKSISKKKVNLSFLELDKNNPKGSIHSDLKSDKKIKKVFLIDDVLNTGKTLAYSISFLLSHNYDSIKTLVLIDRNHKQFPIKVDYKGISLSTNLDANVKLLNDKKKLTAILF